MEVLAWRHLESGYFASADPAFERFQKWPDDASFELIETSYFGFNIPEEQLNCEIYHWYHPKLGVSSGGVFIYRGIKPVQTAAEYLDFRSYMPMPENTVDCTQHSGIRVDMLEPSKRFRVRYEAVARATSFDFESEAIMPLPIRANGGHLTQAMRTHGKLVLRGREYKIDGHFTRDRSWGDPRTETPLPIPVLGWNVGVFGDDFAFHTAAFDSPKYHPERTKTYPSITDATNHLWGYVWKGGKLRGVKHVDQITDHGPDGLYPTGMRLRIEDSEGDTHDIKGTVIGGLPFNPWNNMTAYFCLARWECDGRIGHGDLQDCAWNDYVQAAFNATRNK